MATKEETEVKKALEILERSYQTLLKAGKQLSLQLSRGAAKCSEIREYNLLMMATYNAQRGWLEMIRAEGVEAPETPPFPILFALMGQSGQSALIIDCAALPNIVGPQEIKIVTTSRQAFRPGASPEFQRFTHGELGAIFIPILIAGVAIALTTGVVIHTLSNNAAARKLSADHVKDVEIRANALLENSRRRGVCNRKCLRRRKDPSSTESIQVCAASCDKVHPRIPKDFFPDGTPKMGGGLLVTAGKIAIVAALAIGGAVIYKRYRRNRLGKSSRRFAEFRESPRLRHM